MNDGLKIGRKFLVPGLALLALLLLGTQTPVSADRDAKATRSSQGGKSPTMSRTSSPPSRSATSRATSSGPSRSTAARSASRRASDTRQSTPASRGRKRSSYRPHRHHLGLSFGYGGYYRYGYYGHYGYPYAFYPFYWGVPYHVPRRAYRSYELGAFDLNVRPKKAEVYLDGQFIGKAGQFDGFPDHLWLEQGSYELIFYRPGLATERRVLSVYPGVVVDVRLELRPGESVPPSELTRAQPAEEAMAEVSSAYRRQPPAAAPAAPAKAELDTRAAPGRVRLSVAPADASVYLDGRLLGSGDELARLHAGLVVDAGSHLIEVVRPGYETERLEFAVDSGEDVELEVLLEAG